MVSVRDNMYYSSRDSSNHLYEEYSGEIIFFRDSQWPRTILIIMQYQKNHPWRFSAERKNIQIPFEIAGSVFEAFLLEDFV